MSDDPTVAVCNVCEWTSPARRGDLVKSITNSNGECTQHEVFRP